MMNRMRMLYSLSSVILVLLWQFHVSDCQQAYVNNKQLDCDNHYNVTDGFVCNGASPSCLSYLTFRSTPSYDSAATIAFLLGAETSRVAQINQVSSVEKIPTGTPVIVPVNCSCSGNYSQSNASYTLQSSTETYFVTANNTYQGLTTCQAMISQNPAHPIRNLTAGLNLLVPLRCACPTPNQTAAGINYLLTYLIDWGNSFSYIAGLFGVDEQTLLDANQLSSDSIIYPFTTFLVPLKTAPTKIQIETSSPPAPSPESPAAPVNGSESSKKWVFVGVGIGAGLLLLALLGLLICFFYRRSRKGEPVSGLNKKLPVSADYSSVPENKSWSVSSEGIRYAIESLTVYKFEELQKATGFFSEANRVKGSVYRGSFKGDYAAVKMMKGDVSNEINILKQINHSNVIRLSGFCVHEGNTYLVYEYAEQGSVSDWLHRNRKESSDCLGWKQRVQIAHDAADALNYLHNYTNPPYIHKNLKSSNILLDSNLRAKVANFGLARIVENEKEGGLQLTRHVVGTQGYLAPEYIENGVVTPKLDVFAFGVIILELISGREAASDGDKNNGREELLFVSIRRVVEGENVREKLRGFMDPQMRDDYPLDLAFSMAQLANNCVAHDLNARPSMSDVFMTLSKILSSTLDWDPSDDIDRSRSLSHGR